MNIQASEYKSRKYKSARSHPGQKSKSETVEFDFKKKEVAENVVRSLDEARKFLRGELELKSIDGDLVRWMKIAEEMGENEHRGV